MAIKGSLKEASLADVLQLLALGQKTGCLTVIDRTNLGYIYFDRGRIVYASLVNRLDRLGDILLKSGRISTEQLQEGIDLQSRHRERRLGEILVKQGAISQADLEHFMRMQIEEAVYFLFTWTRGTFTFESDVRPVEQEFTVSINPETLLLEGARRVDEWSLIEKKIPSMDLIFALHHDRLEASEVRLTSEQQHLVPLLDGTRDVARLVEDSGLVEFDVGKALYGLITAGFVHRVGRTQAPRPAVAGETRADEHRNLGVAFYRTGMVDEATREFRRVVDLRPADGSAYFYLGLIALRQGHWEAGAAYFTRALEYLGPRATVLANLALSLEKAGRYDEAENAYSEAGALAPQDPRILTGWGIVALHRGEFEVAIGRLDQAREVAGEGPLPPLWYWARSLAAAALDRLPQADALLRKGLEAYEDHPVLSNNLAVVLEMRGDVDRAVDVLHRAMSDEQPLPQVAKNLGDLLYRAARYEDAWEAYQRAIRLQPTLGDDVYFRLGNIAYKRQDRQLAIEYWNRALELNPRHELARTNLETVSALS
ncbi:MAG: tetratricopeptide repeat protein [Gemmatimonadales bacterium]|nr:tetratricopeptide repeat protein [Gemmatimonadales bacterium]